MAVKEPGFDNTVGNRNRRVNRFAVAGGNVADRRHKVLDAATIGFATVPNPDEIQDSGNGLGGYEVGEFIDIQRSASNDGVVSAQTVLPGAIGVNEALVLEAAGAQIQLASLNNARDSRFS